MNKLYEIKNLKKYFYIKSTEIFKSPNIVKAVDGINLDIYNNEVLGIVGESGCGKSTLGRLLIRLLDPTDGQIIFNNEDISLKKEREIKELRKDFQMIFQDPYESLNPRLKVKTILKEPYKIHNLYDKNTEIKIKELMDTVGLSLDYINRYPHEFSGGQRQRIGIARALALNPKFIVADEPVSALDVSIQAQILNLLSKIKEDLGLTIAFIAHDLGVIQYISTRVVVMYLGQMVELADTEELFNNPFHPYTKALLSAVPVPDPDYIYNANKMVKGEIPSPVNPPSGCVFHPRCKYVMDICKKEKPQFKPLSKKHLVTCHLNK